MQLDDWVLCRIYNKKGVLEKHLNSDIKSTSKTPFTEMEIETKPNITPYSSPMGITSSLLHPQSSIPHHVMNDTFNFETSESVPTIHTDSSSEHEKEVQSEVKRDDYQFNYMDPFADDAFTPQSQYYNDYQLSPLQDMFMFMPKSFQM